VRNQNCYIEFDILEDKNFNDLKHTFDLIKAAKNKGQPQTDQFWLDNFPDYSLKQFYFSDTDIKPKFKTTDKSEFIWHFYSLTSLLQTDYDINYRECFKTDNNHGRLEYNPFSYPYGGSTGLITFINSFNCKPTKIDDGTSVYEITFIADGDFSITDLNDPAKQNSSVKRFDGIELIKKFVDRLKQ
jgi:hypothetical protein